MRRSRSIRWSQPRPEGTWRDPHLGRDSYLFVHFLLHFLCFKNANRDLNEGGPRPSGRDTTPQCPFIWFVIRNLFIPFYRFKHANHDINEGAPLQFAIGSFSSIASNERIPTERGGQRRKRPKTTHRGPSTLHPTIIRTCRRQIQTIKLTVSFTTDHHSKIQKRHT